MDLPNLFSGEGPFFFSGLTARPTYHPSVQHSNPDTPLVQTSKCLSHSDKNIMQGTEYTGSNQAQPTSALEATCAASDVKIRACA